ncbi:GNAT family N-acetyltransferase [Brevundimonas sp. AJA228-03]|uniref:GNAT family N-acetyltransferase n=1 Tax=Brevundimonas sp. AJA228-03 TaxID=2752515 RepID=UPI001ADF39F1|nr:GNAT family N-acetyltransferase [Brevundimonas sp. AJA228-03]QTN19114.1 GNAT family N-acetyltransferase [Brevundimonas sp. AJA228-03]
MEIVTPRLTLRPAGPDDLEPMHAVLSDPRAVQWWSTPPHETLDQTRGWLEAMISANGSGLDFLIELEGRVVGKAGFYAPPDVGYILHPDVWGRGLATEAVGAVLDRLFETTDHAMATADVDPANAASIRLLEKLGFLRTGFAENTWNVGGVWKDSFYYALSREAWSRRRQG